MQKNKNRRGLALGAALSLVASLFVMTAPAQADETNVVMYPNAGLETQTTMLNGQAFDLAFRFGTGVGASLKAYSPDTSAAFGVEITKPAGTTVSAVVGGVTTTSAGADITATTFNVGVQSSGSPVLALSLPSRTSVSSAVTLTVTPYLDINRNADRDAGEPYGTAVDVTFVPWSSLGASLVIGAATSGDSGVTASFTVDSTLALNYSMLDEGLTISLSSTADQAATGSASVTGTQLSATSGANSGTEGDANGYVEFGGYSASFSVLTAPLTASPTVESVSGIVMYLGDTLVEATTLAVTPLGVAGTTLSPVTGPNAVQTSAGGDARINSAFVLKAYPYSASITTSVAIDSAFTVSSSTIEFDATSGVVLNGTTYTSSAAFAAAGFTVPAGTTTIAMSTFGQANASQMVATLTSQLVATSLTLEIKGAAQTVGYTGGNAAVVAGSAKSLAVTAYDQWDVASVRTDQRIAASVVLGGSVSETVSANVVNGEATVAVTPTPATRTGSAVVTFTLQTFNQSTQNWDNGDIETATLNVISAADAAGTFTSRTVSISASISYGTDLSWSPTAVSVGTEVSYSEIVVSAPGLMIRDANDATATASDTLTVNANGQSADFEFTSRLAGTYTVTFTTGTATTTSEVVVDVAAHDSGETMTFDVNSLVAGETTTITGTLVDANGNPVMTSGSSNVSVAYTGKGLPFGTSTEMETDADGQLTFQVLVLSTEKGDAAISATYKPAGLTVDTDNITVVHGLAVGTVAAADAKVNAGSFKGYVAVYARGYEGQRLSAKIGKDWVIVDPIVNNQENGTLFRVTDFTGAGVDIAVRIYIDRVLIDTINLTTK